MTRHDGFRGKSTGHFAIGEWTPIATKGDVQTPVETPSNNVCARGKLRGEYWIQAFKTNPL